MATTVEELIKYLERIPPDTELRVLVVEDCEYQTCANYKPMDISDFLGNVSYCDLSNISPDLPNFGKKYLDFGEC